LLTAPGGPDSMDTVGGAVSTANARDAGVVSTMPDASLARTRKVCAPSGSSVSARGDLHGANGAASRLHANRAADCVEENANDGLASPVGPLGPASIRVSGAPAAPAGGPSLGGSVAASASAAGSAAIAAARRTVGRRRTRWLPNGDLGNELPGRRAQTVHDCHLGAHGQRLQRNLRRACPFRRPRFVSGANIP
jgi:hypothetical protein